MIVVSSWCRGSAEPLSTEPVCGKEFSKTGTGDTGQETHGVTCSLLPFSEGARTRDERAVSQILQ